jgi:hypothetical protein
VCVCVWRKGRRKTRRWKVELIPRILGFVPKLISHVTGIGKDLATGSETSV